MKRMSAFTRRAARICAIALVVAVFSALSSGVGVAAFTSAVSGATEFGTRDLLSPSGLTATGSCSSALSATLDWSAGSAWADGQELWRSTTAGSDGVRVATTTATAVTYTDGTVTTGSTYYYRVKSVKVGWVESSSEVSFVC